MVISYDHVFFHTMRCFILPLWGQFSSVTMNLVQEDNFHNAEQGFRFRKAMLWATHPQRLFYEQPRSPITIRQDLVLKAAFEIVNFKLNLDPDYFKSKHWSSKTPSAYQLGLTRAEMYRKSLSSRQGLPLQDFEDTVEDRERETAVAVGFSMRMAANGTNISTGILTAMSGPEISFLPQSRPQILRSNQISMIGAIPQNSLLPSWSGSRGRKKKSLLLRECFVSKRHGDRTRKLRRHSAN